MAMARSLVYHPIEDPVEKNRLGFTGVADFFNNLSSGHSANC